MNRKTFLKIFLSSFGLFIFFLWGKLTENSLSNPANKKQVVLPNDFSNGITLHDDLIVIKNNDKLRILSSRCTHLGCRINNVNENILTCPCHGSQFDLNGIPVKGPAAKNLTELKFKIDLKQNQIIIFT